MTDDAIKGAPYIVRTLGKQVEILARWDNYEAPEEDDAPRYSFVCLCDDERIAQNIIKAITKDWPEGGI